MEERKYTEQNKNNMIKTQHKKTRKGRREKKNGREGGQGERRERRRREEERVGEGGNTPWSPQISARRERLSRGPNIVTGLKVLAAGRQADGRTGRGQKDITEGKPPTPGET